jgi:4-hydroxy-tetrahydrodipicolinate synthase
MTPTPGRFGAVLTAMVTPFDGAGHLDLDGARDLARWLVDQGNDGLVVAGTTGESPTLSDSEKLDLWAAVAEAVTVPVVAGSGTNDTRHSVELTAKAAGTGVAAILAVTPYYNRPSQAGLARHFTAVAEAAGDLPVMLYDIPVRSGRKIATDTMVDLARSVANIVAVKDAAGDVPETARLMERAGAGFEVYSGNDSDTLALLRAGARGTVGVATHWVADPTARMFAAVAAGDEAEADRLDALMAPSYEFESTDDAPNPIPAKALLRTLGWDVGRGRPPMDTEPDDLEDRARRLLADLGDDAPRPRG